MHQMTRKNRSYATSPRQPGMHIAHDLPRQTLRTGYGMSMGLVGSLQYQSLEQALQLVNMRQHRAAEQYTSAACHLTLDDERGEIVDINFSCDIGLVLNIYPGEPHPGKSRCKSLES